MDLSKCGKHPYLQRSIAIQTGRPHSLRVGAFERNARSWSLRPTSRVPDVGLAASKTLPSGDHLFRMGLIRPLVLEKLSNYTGSRQVFRTFSSYLVLNDQTAQT